MDAASGPQYGWLDVVRVHWADTRQERPLIRVRLQRGIDNTLQPLSRGPFCSGNAIRFPNPPLGIVSWLGNSRSYEFSLSCRVRVHVWLMMAVPKRRASRAETLPAKNTQA